MIRYVIPLLFFIVTGCSIIQDTDDDLVRIGILSDTLAQSYNIVSEQVLARTDIPENEMTKLKGIDKRAKQLLIRFDAVRYGEQISDKELYRLYIQAKSLYIEAKELIKIHYKDWPKEERLLLKIFDQRAIELNNKVEFTHNTYNENVEVVELMQQFVILILKILIPCFI